MRSPSSALARAGVRAGVLVAGLAAGGALLGLLRDLVIASYFGASKQTDAFLVAWMVPETVVPLLIVQALPLLLVPLFTHELQHKGDVRELVAATLWPYALVLAGASLLIAVAAPWIVRAIAPGLADPGLATSIMRMASVSVLTLGMSGYAMAALRAHDRAVLPASLNTVFNLGIVACIVLLHARLGVGSAGLGLVVGSLLVLALQAAGFLMVIGRPPLRRVRRAAVWGLAGFLPAAAYSIGRHAQLYVERFLASDLDPGAISHLNYAQKIGQLPMTLTTTLAWLAFPALVRAAASNDRLRDAVQGNLIVAATLIVPAIAFLVVDAVDVAQVLFERGAFDHADTVATADVLRIYAFGVLGQTFVGILVMPFFSTSGARWAPGWVSLVGLGVVTLTGVVALPWLGTGALALGNAAGITAMMVLLLLRLRAEVVPVDLRVLLGHLARCSSAGAAAALCAAALLRLPVLSEAPAAARAVSSGLFLLAVYVALGTILRIEGFERVRRMLSRRSVGV